METKSWIADGKFKCSTCLFWSGRLKLVFVPPGAVVSGLQQTCSRVYVNRTVVCTSCRPCLTFSWTAGFLAGAEPARQRHFRWN